MQQPVVLRIPPSCPADAGSIPTTLLIPMQYGPVSGIFGAPRTIPIACRPALPIAQVARSSPSCLDSQADIRELICRNMVVIVVQPSRFRLILAGELFDGAIAVFVFDL